MCVEVQTVHVWMFLDCEWLWHFSRAGQGSGVSSRFAAMPIFRRRIGDWT